MREVGCFPIYLGCPFDDPYDTSNVKRMGTRSHLKWGEIGGLDFKVRVRLAKILGTRDGGRGNSSPRVGVCPYLSPFIY